MQKRSAPQSNEMESEWVNFLEVAGLVSCCRDLHSQEHVFRSNAHSEIIFTFNYRNWEGTRPFFKATYRKTVFPFV